MIFHDIPYSLWIPLAQVNDTLSSAPNCCVLQEMQWSNLAEGDYAEASPGRSNMLEVWAAVVHCYNAASKGPADVKDSHVVLF